MKRNKFNIFAMVALGGLMICSPIARADDTTPGTPAAPGSPTPGVRAGAGGRGAGMMELIKSLDLTADQKPKFRETIKEQREKMTALRQDSSLSEEQKQARRKAIFEATDASLKSFLTADQYAKWQAAEKNMHPGAGGKGKGEPTTSTDVVPPKS